MISGFNDHIFKHFTMMNQIFEENVIIIFIKKS